MRSPPRAGRGRSSVPHPLQNQVSVQCVSSILHSPLPAPIVRRRRFYEILAFCPDCLGSRVQSVAAPFSGGQAAGKNRKPGAAGQHMARRGDAGAAGQAWRGVVMAGSASTALRSFRQIVLYFKLFCRCAAIGRVCNVARYFGFSGEAMAVTVGRSGARSDNLARCQSGILEKQIDIAWGFRATQLVISPKRREKHCEADPTERSGTGLRRRPCLRKTGSTETQRNHEGPIDCPPVGYPLRQQSPVGEIPALGTTVARAIIRAAAPRDRVCCRLRRHRRR